MKIKILRGDRGKWYYNTDNIGKEFDIEDYYVTHFKIIDGYWANKDDCVITELPESFCVKRCDDNNRDDWNKYLQWLNKQKNYPIPMFGGVDRYKYYGVNGENLHSDYLYPFGTEIHLDDMIKHIDFYSEPMVLESKEETNMENTVIKVLTPEHGKKVIEWWKKQGIDTRDLNGIACESDGDTYIYYGVIKGRFDNWSANAVKISKAKIIELPTDEEEFDMSTNKGRLAYAKKHYPIGTKYIPIDNLGNLGKYYEELSKSEFNPRWFNPRGTYIGIECGVGYIYANGKWAEIINEETNMNTQRLSRQGLKEIHSVACTSWKEILEKYGANNPLEDYIELTQAQVDTMFNSCTKEQLPIVSKYLKQNDGSVDVTKFTLSGKGFCDDNFYIIRDREWGEYKKQSFLLSERYDWEIKTDNVGELCLIPSKKKQSLTSSGASTGYGEVNTAYTSGITTGKYSVGF